MRVLLTVIALSLASAASAGEWRNSQLQDVYEYGLMRGLQDGPPPDEWRNTQWQDIYEYGTARGLYADQRERDDDARLRERLGELGLDRDEPPRAPTEDDGDARYRRPTLYDRD